MAQVENRREVTPLLGTENITMMSSQTQLDNLKKVLTNSDYHFRVFEALGEREIVFPKFDLFARDYLLAADAELNSFFDRKGQTDEYTHLINCVASLKRAIDCAVDFFLSVYGLHKTFKKRNLKLETKLDFLRQAGVFSSRSISRLNNIRNRMEHDYEIPVLSDIELYYDLVSAFVAVIELTATFARYDICFFSILRNERECGAIGFMYDYEKPTIQVDWGIWDKDTLEKIDEDIILCNPNDYTTYAFLFKVMLLLIQIENYTSTGYISRYLQK